VILVEARDRVGGRVWPRTIAGSTTPAELGAEFIHGPAEQTMALLREANVNVVGTMSASWLCSKLGEIVRDREDFTASARSLEGARALAVDESAAQYLQRIARDKATRGTEESARAFIEGFEAADPAIASARAIADELHSGVDDRSARPVGGYGAMLGLLRHKCDAAGVRIALSTILKRISWRRGAVAVEVQELGRLRTLQARAVIVTLPIGVLRYRGDETRIIFKPELPAIKRNALHKLEMGHVVKVALSFQTAFWEHLRGRRYRDAAYFRCNGQPFGAYWTLLPVRSTQIVAWAGGPKATALIGRSDAELIDLALDSFGAVFDERKLASAEFECGTMHDWNNDPFARGAYSYVVVGGGDARRELGAPVDDTLFFAGEATSTDGQGGTVNGALVTGERAASAAARALAQKGEIND
jgi:monoamine oxidase